jgi:pentatricopeptide repeat protein
VIDCIAQHGENPEKAEAIIDRMVKAGVRPNVVTYSAVISGKLSLLVAFQHVLIDLHHIISLLARRGYPGACRKSNFLFVSPKTHVFGCASTSINTHTTHPQGTGRRKREVNNQHSQDERVLLLFSSKSQLL